ncbi:MAG: MOSC domain-containing protein YiiM [Myxococcota bacterium]|jgi:MOSC domain-containing protein YiiM
MSEEPSIVHRLLNTLPQQGTVQWIGLSPGRREPIHEVDHASIQVGTGLIGDRHATSGRGKRQVTLIQAEHIDAIRSMAGLETLAPADLRRNVVVSGVNLLALKNKTFRLGTALLEYTGPCDPCSRMEETLGPGGFNAMRGHGGITTKVLEAGEVRVGDKVIPIVGDSSAGKLG